MGKFTYKKYNKEDQKLLATWATDCAERVLPFFEKEFPKNDRPKKVIETSRTWVKTHLRKEVVFLLKNYQAVLK